MSHKVKKIIEFPEADKSHFLMIDVGSKRPTLRRAIAVGTITLGEVAFGHVRNITLPKGDVLALAEVAGIMGAKKTPELLPMCHTLPLDQITIHCELNEADHSIRVYCQAAAHAKTGVEMEAISGVNAALMTIWDLTKGVEPALQISDVRLLVKEGGKSGLWTHPLGIPEWLKSQLPDETILSGVSAAVVIMSDRASAGEYQDLSGPVIQEMLIDVGASVGSPIIIPDDKEEVASALKNIAVQDRPSIIFTSGGTGFGKRDITPEALQMVCDRMIPGFGELLRKDGAYITDLSWLSRSCAGLIEETMIVSLPGSPKAVKEGLGSLLPILPHALKMIKGGTHDD